MMHPWLRDDCGHELHSSLLLQHVPNPGASRLDSCIEGPALASAGSGACWWVCVCARAAGRGDGRVSGKACLLLQYQFGVPSPTTEGLLVLLFFSSHSINNSIARSAKPLHSFSLCFHSCSSVVGSLKASLYKTVFQDFFFFEVLVQKGQSCSLLSPPCI